MRENWTGPLASALTQFDQKKPQPLQVYANQAGTYRAEIFEQLFDAYYKQMKQDEDAFNHVRLDNFEQALDTPKTEATTCEKKKVFGPPVETTWCESGTYPQLLLQGPPKSGKSVFLPNTSSLKSGYETAINTEAAKGQVCGPNTGDPYWAIGCACKCGDIVGAVNGGVTYCQNEHIIKLHDMHVTSQLECLASLASGEGEKDDEAPFN